MKKGEKDELGYSCKYHVVFCPKYRRSVLINGVDFRLKELIQQTCEQLNVEIIEMEIMPDHVHLLMEVDPQFGVHKAVKQIKRYGECQLKYGEYSPEKIWEDLELVNKTINTLQTEEAKKCFGKK